MRRRRLSRRSQLAQLRQEEIALQLGAGGQRHQIRQRRDAPELRNDQHPDRAERAREVDPLADRLLGRLSLRGIGAEETGDALDCRDRNRRGGERLQNLGRREQECPGVQLDGIQPDRLEPRELVLDRLAGNHPFPDRNLHVASLIPLSLRVSGYQEARFP
jgi:hypothetical protein